MKWIPLLLTLFVANTNVVAAECLAPGSAVELFGTIGKGLVACDPPQLGRLCALSVSMNLTFQEDRLIGSYAYVKHEKRIALTGKCTGGSLTLQESDASGKATGSFSGSFAKPQVVEGTWSSADGKKKFPFHLQALPPADHVSGKCKTGGGYYPNQKQTGDGAELNILLLDDGQLRIQGTASWASNLTKELLDQGKYTEAEKLGGVNYGYADGTAKLGGGKAEYVDTDPDSNCHFTIEFGNRNLDVTDQSGYCGGHRVTFEGTYQRVGPPTFQEEPN